MGKKFEFTEEVLAEIEECAGLGLTEDQIIHNIGIHRSTFYEHKRGNPDISYAIKKGKADAIKKVSNKLFQNAMKGNLGAQIFFLKTQSPESFSEKHEGDDKQPQQQVLLKIVPPEGYMKDKPLDSQQEHGD